jgi:hypothetical protein
MSTIHPFTRAGFGPAPFRCVGMTVEKYQACHGAPIQPGTTCDYCGTGIMNAYWIENADKSRKFKVGCDCVAKTNAEVTGFKAAKSQHDKTVRDARNAKAREARAAARLENQRAFEIKREERGRVFATDHGDVITFLSGFANHGGGFLCEMYRAVGQYGALTDGQLAAVRKIMAQNVEREAAAAASIYLGEVGKPLTITGEIVAKSEREYTDRWPARVVHWHLIRTTDGNTVTFRGVRLGAKGDTVTATFTVKAHEGHETDGRSAPPQRDVAHA